MCRVQALGVKIGELLASGFLAFLWVRLAIHEQVACLLHTTRCTANKSEMTTMLLAPSEVLKKGLHYCGIRNLKKKSSFSKAANEKLFCQHYGSTPLVIADIWYDLTVTELEDNEKSEKGFKMFMAAIHFLWTYPKNSNLLASRFHISERNSRGEPLWKWIKKVQSLKAKKIVWDSSLDDPNTQIFITTVDGTDCRIWEKKHPHLPVDKKFFSQKFNHCGVKYEIGISVYHSKVVWINGPYRAGEHDKTVLRKPDGLKTKVKEGKLVIADAGYVSSRADEQFLAVPNAKDPKELKNFKSRARCHHETFNGHIKFFKCLSETFRHGIEKHKIAFEAVCVIVQYQMDNGAEIFAV